MFCKMLNLNFYRSGLLVLKFCLLQHSNRSKGKDFEGKNGLSFKPSGQVFQVHYVFCSRTCTIRC